MPFFLYIQREYLVRMRSVAFWLVTLLAPLPLLYYKFFTPSGDFFVAAGEEAAGVDDTSSYVMIYASVLFLFVFFYGVQTMRSVAIVRRERVVELLLTCLKPWQIVIGQILAVGLVALTQLCFWVFFVLCIGLSLPGAGISVLSVLWLLGGYAIYASLFAIAGVYVASENASQAVTLLITALSVVALNVSIYSIGNPYTSASKFCSLFPLTSPLMFGTGQNNEVELQLLSALILCVSCVLVMSMGCRYFKRNCLK